MSFALSFPVTSASEAENTAAGEMCRCEGVKSDEATEDQVVYRERFQAVLISEARASSHATMVASS